MTSHHSAASIVLLLLLVKACAGSGSLENVSSSSQVIHDDATIQLDDTITAINRTREDAVMPYSPRISPASSSNVAANVVVTTSASSAVILSTQITFPAEIKEKRETNNPPDSATSESEQALPICTHSPNRRHNRRFDDYDEEVEMRQKRPRSAGGRWGGLPTMGMFGMSMNPMELGMGMNPMDMTMAGLNPIAARHAAMAGQMGMNPMMGNMAMNPMTGGMVPGMMVMDPSGMNSMRMMAPSMNSMGVADGGMATMGFGGPGVTADGSVMNGMMPMPMNPASPMGMAGHDLNQNLGMAGADGSGMMGRASGPVSGLGMNTMMTNMGNMNNNPMAQQQMMGMAVGGAMNGMQMSGMVPQQQSMMGQVGLQANVANQAMLPGLKQQQNPTFVQNGQQNNGMRITRNDSGGAKATSSSTDKASGGQARGMEKPSADKSTAAESDAKQQTGKKDLDRMFKMMSSVMEQVLSETNKAKDDNKPAQVDTSPATPMAVTSPTAPMVVDMLATPSIAPSVLANNALFMQQQQAHPGMQSPLLLQTSQNPPQSQSPLVQPQLGASHPNVQQASSMQSYLLPVMPSSSSQQQPSLPFMLSHSGSTFGQQQQHQSVIPSKPLPQTLVPLGVPSIMPTFSSVTNQALQPQSRVHRQLMTSPSPDINGHNDTPSSSSSSTFSSAGGLQVQSTRHYNVAAETRIIRRKKPVAAVAGLKEELNRIAQHIRRDHQINVHWPHGQPPNSSGESASSSPPKSHAFHRRSSGTWTRPQSLRHYGKQCRFPDLFPHFSDVAHNETKPLEAGQDMSTISSTSRDSSQVTTTTLKMGKDESLGKKALKFFMRLFAKRAASTTESPETSTMDSLSTVDEKVLVTSRSSPGPVVDSQNVPE